MLPSQKKKLRAERAAMQPQYDPNDPDAIIPVQEEMIEAAPGQQLVKPPLHFRNFILYDVVPFYHNYFGVIEDLQDFAVSVACSAVKKC